MNRIATNADAEQLSILNEAFNGNEKTIDDIRKSLTDNQQERVIVEEIEGKLVGFVCVQLKSSFCYKGYSAEITEVYVDPSYRKKGIASNMIRYAEQYCMQNYPLHHYELLTAKENKIAQTLYAKLGYVEDEELHLVKKIENNNVKSSVIR